VRRSILLGAIGLLVLLTVAPSFGSGAASGQVRGVQTIKQISRDELPQRPDSMRDTEVGPTVAVDPNDPLRAVTVFQQGRFGGGSGSVGNGYATTSNGGETWVTAPLPGLTVPTGGEWARASEPSVAFGPDGTVYASSLVFDRLLCPSAVVVQSSVDGGLTWGDPHMIQRDDDCSIFNDKDRIVVDTYPASPFFGRIYLVWERTESGRDLVLTWSDDGESWSPFVQVSAGDFYAVSPVPVVQPDGDLTVVYGDWFDDFLLAQTSSDGGLTFSPAVNVGTYESTEPSDFWTGSLNNKTSVSVDPLTGAIYVVWQDGRHRTDGLNDVVLSISANGGATWSSPQRVNLDPPDSLIDHLTPAVAAHGNVVHVTYVHRDMSVGLNQEVNQHYIVSADGGDTFGGDVRLGRSSDLTWAARQGNDYLALLGEHVGIAANNQLAYAVWPRSTMPREIVLVYHQTMWAAAIEVAG
jgi:hypothetical protein